MLYLFVDAWRESEDLVVIQVCYPCGCFDVLHVTNHKDGVGVYSTLEETCDECPPRTVATGINW